MNYKYHQGTFVLVRFSTDLNKLMIAVKGWMGSIFTEVIFKDGLYVMLCLLLR